MKCQRIVLLCLILFNAGRTYAQSPVIEWQKCLGGYWGDYPNSIRATTDGGYIVAGYTEYGGGDVMGYHGNPAINDYWVVKLSSTGSIQWEKCLGGVYQDQGSDVRQTPDGGYIVAGSAASQDCNVTGNHGGLDYWIVKLSPTGDILWQKSLGGSKHEYGYSIDLTADGGFVVAGLTESSDGDVTGNHGIRDYWVVKLDGSGNLQWQKALGGSGDDEANAIRATPDGGCIVAGFTESSDGDVTGYHGQRDGWIVKLGSGGSLQWQKALGGSNYDVLNSIQLTTDGGYIAAGSTSSNDGNVSGNNGDADYWVVKLDNGGAVQWQKCYGGPFNELAYYIQSTPDGGYTVAGSAESSAGELTCNAGITDMWLIKINSIGALEWQKSLGGGSYDEAHSIQPLADGSYIVAGNTCSVEVPGYHPHTGYNGTCADFWIVKLSSPVSTPPAPVVTIDPASGHVCTGTNNTFTATALNTGVSPVYQWVRNGSNVGANSSTYTANNLVAGDKLACFVNSGGVCDLNPLQASATLTIKADAPIQPQIMISASSTYLCNCTPITFKATVLNGSSSPKYQWKLNGQNTDVNGSTYISAGLQAGDIVTCLYSDNAGCIVNGSILSNAIQINGSSSQASLLTITASQKTICSGSPVSFIASPVNAGTNPGFQWKINGTDAGTDSSGFTTASLLNGDIVTCTVTPDPLFTCSVTNNVNSNGITMAVSPKEDPLVTIKAAKDTICIGETETFTAFPENAGANPIFQWQVNGSNTGSGSSNFISSSLTNGDIVACTITRDPLFTCTSVTTATSANWTVIIKNQPIPSIKITTAGNGVCAGNPVEFKAVSGNAGLSPTYQWIVNNTPLSGNSPALSIPALSNGDLVYCMLEPGAGACSLFPVTSDTITAEIYNLPVIAISPMDTSVFAGSPVQLKTSVTGNIVSYQWSPANQLTDPLSLSPLTVPIKENTQYKLSVEDDRGCSAESTVDVKVGIGLFMPNAFTPDGNGKNDVFRIPPRVLLDLKEFSVFDRWGNRIFTTRDINQGWDGTFHGQKSETGVYVYLVNGSNATGAVSDKGTVILVR